MYLSITAAAVIAIVVTGTLILNTGFENTSLSSSEDGENSNTPQSDSKSVERLSLSSLTENGSPVRGDPDAGITLVEFGDFQCPNCGRFARNTEPQIEQQYIDTGKINMVFKHLPIQGPDSITASMAAQCASDQGKFWDYYSILYNNQKGENTGWANVEKMKEFASEIGIERTKFDQCLENNKHIELIENDIAVAKELGVSGTPSFVVVKSDGSNPEGILGAQPFSSFKSILDRRTGQ